MKDGYIRNVCDKNMQICRERKSHEKVIPYKTNKKLADVIRIRRTKINRYIPSRMSSAMKANPN